MRFWKATTHEYTIEDPVLRSLQCVRCGKEHPVSEECDPIARQEWKAYWQKLGKRAEILLDK